MNAFGFRSPPPQLSYGKPIDLSADVPIFPPAAMILTVFTGRIMARITGIRLSFLKPPLTSVPVRVAVFAVNIAMILFFFDTAGGTLAEAGSGALFTPVGGLATTGLFQITRNPMYCGLLFLSLPMMSVVFNSLWPIFLSPLTWAYLHYVVVAAEEALLSKAFGSEYDKYCSEVPRWLV